MTSTRKEKITALTKVYSREKPLFWLYLWNETDRQGWKKYLKYNVKVNLFLVPEKGQKSSVWYTQSEVDDIRARTRKLLATKAFVPRLIHDLTREWKIVEPYLQRKKQIVTKHDFDDYYRHIVAWWCAMVVAFPVPDMQEATKKDREAILRFRKKSELYSDTMDNLLSEFWQRHFSKLARYYYFATPKDVHKPQTKILQARSRGAFLLNEKVYPLRKLQTVLQQNGFRLEREANPTETKKVHGMTAYPGVMIGKVRKIVSFADLPKFKKGEILVTEMTSPNYVPAMKRAAAIVTDEGGMICHASVVSRELKIPCVVGTKIATKVLHSGQKVRVDANKGIVTILH